MQCCFIDIQALLITVWSLSWLLPTRTQAKVFQVVIEKFILFFKLYKNLYSPVSRY